MQNILFENFYVEGAASGPSISENSGNNGKYSLFSQFILGMIFYFNLER